MAPYRIDLEQTVFTDEKWMNFILGQLIQNSAKYAAGEGAELVFSSRLIDEGLSSERIELEVRDNGCGVEQAGSGACVRSRLHRARTDARASAPRA
ncbi:MAG: hypothetical protein ACLTSX_10205 [Collinsella sp.]